MRKVQYLALSLDPEQDAAMPKGDAEMSRKIFIVHAVHHAHAAFIVRRFGISPHECLVVYPYNDLALRGIRPEDPQYMHVYENHDSEDERCAKRHACEKHREKYAHASN